MGGELIELNMSFTSIIRKREKYYFTMDNYHQLKNARLEGPLHPNAFIVDNVDLNFNCIL
jgi:hypothetical protein